jgi:peptidoglycan L-alanyl-D-glutamate endopeptidase CwlK
MFGNDCLFLQRFLKSLGYYDGELDGDFGPLTDAALDRFEIDAEKIANDLGRFDPRSEKNIAGLHIKAQALARRFLRASSSSPELKAHGVTVRIISGTRTYQEQADLFAQGRSKPGRVVTKARPGRSNHNFGIAWDIGLFKGTDYLDESALYDSVGMIGKDLGLEWGGDWPSFIDKPHFQLKTATSLLEIRAKFEGGSAFA